MTKLFGDAGQLQVSGLVNTPALFGDGLPVVLNSNPGESPVPALDVSPSVPLHSFRFGTAVLNAGGVTAEFDPFNHVHFEKFGSRVIITDGMTINKEFDGDRVTDLEILAPSSAPSVAAGASQTGSTGTYKYKYRYRCSKTGKVSGFSPASSSISVTDQKVNITSIANSSDDQVDGIQIFRTLNDSFSYWFLVDEIDNTTTSYIDDISVNDDDTIGDNESGDLIEGRMYTTGRMWPMLKSFAHFGFVYYYGLVRMPDYSAGTVSVTNGSSEITGAGGCRVRYNRLGQRLELPSDTTVYTIVDVDETNNKFYVNPVVARSTGSGLTYKIRDNRQGGTVEISEAQRPGSVPVTHRLNFGSDVNDDVILLFELHSKFFAITNKNIILISGDRTVDPWNNLSIDEVVVEEGACGPEAAALIPGVGLVYVNSELGPRAFDGEKSTYLGGGHEETLVSSEWKRFRASSLEETVVRFDKSRNLVYIGYARDDEPELGYRIVYSIPYGELLGPWTGSFFEFGKLLHNDLTPRNLIGSSLGCLYHDRLGTRDGYDSGTLEGEITSISGRTITVSGASFKTTGEGLYGAVVELISPSLSSVAYGTVVQNTATTLTLRGFPSPVPAVGWTVRIAPVSWNVVTGYIDGSDPHHVKTLWSLQLRHSKGAGGYIRAAASVDGGLYYTAESGEVNLDGGVHTRFVFRKGGTAFQIYVSGSGNAEAVEVTQVVLEAELRRKESD